MNYETLRKNCPDWQAYINHDFVQQLGNGTLAKASFLHYLRQDYLFLIQFTRMFALGVYKSENIAQMRAGQAGINAMLDTEINLHIDYCASWGIAEKDIINTPESPATVAYTRYVLDCGITGTLADLYAAVAPCMMGYAEIGKLLGQQAISADNPYRSWIAVYSGDDYQAVAAESEAFMNTLFASATAYQGDKLQHFFNTATRMEVAFWQMGLDLH